MKVVFDLDGTICNVEKLLPLWETDKELFFLKFNQAEPISRIIKLCNSLWADGQAIYFYTARPEKTRYTTLAWIKKNMPFLTEKGVDYFNLLMAGNSDTRHDKDIKLSMLQAYGIEPENTIIFEDRSCVVEHLRANGFTVLQIANNNY